MQFGGFHDMRLSWIVVVLLLGIWFGEGRRGAGRKAVNEGGDGDLVFDYVIVGAGPGGSVLARRFADNGDSVALIEMGPDSCTRCKGNLDVILSAVYDARVKVFFPKPQSWTYDRAPTFLAYEGANGGSEIYAGIYVRPSKALLDQFPTGFKYADLLPEMKELEDHYCHYFPNGLESTTFPIPYPDISPEDCATYHGKGGPIQVSPQQPAKLAPQIHALLSSGLLFGSAPFTFTSDYNGSPSQRTGVGYEQNFRGRDNLTDIGSGRSKGKIFDFLLPKDYRRSHPNLRIFFNSRVMKLLFHKSEINRVIGVAYLPVSSPDFGDVLLQRVFARKQVFLSAGVVHTTQLLQLNGIGPASLLSKNGIKIRAINEYVGTNISTHQVWPMGFQSRIPVDHDPKDTSITVADAFFHSNPVKAATGAPADMQVIVTEGSYLESFEYPALGPPKGIIAFGKEDPPYSALGVLIVSNLPSVRGSIAIQSTNPFVEPAIDYGWDSKMDTSGETLKLVATMQRVRKWILETLGPKSPFDTSSPVVKELWPGDTWNDLLEKQFPGWSLMPPLIKSALADSFHIKNTVHHLWHIMGSCYMGEDSDDASCSDTHGRVRGVTGLSVCDNSIYPTPPDGNPTAGLIAICSKIAKWHITNTVASQVGPQDLS